MTQNSATGWPLAVKAENMLVAQAGDHRVAGSGPFLESPAPPIHAGLTHQEFTPHSLSFLPAREKEGHRGCSFGIFAHCFHGAVTP